MRIRAVAVGRVKESYFAQAVKEYEKRISRYAKFEISETEEELAPKKLEKEAKHLLPKLSGFVIVLDKDGEKLGSEELAERLNKAALTNGEITFVIGGSEGLDKTVKGRADMTLSFGGITLPHSLARVVLSEQIYRALTIINGRKYHK